MYIYSMVFPKNFENPDEAFSVAKAWAEHREKRLFGRNRKIKEDPILDDNDEVLAGYLSRVERVETSITAYLCSDDVDALLERLDSYAGDKSWKLVTLDRTNDGKFYAFLTRMG